MLYPIDIPPGSLGQPFGVNFLMYSHFMVLAPGGGLQPMKGHPGFDFPIPIGNPVYAIHDGWIVASQNQPTGYGRYLALYYEENGVGFEWIFGHFDSVNFPDISDDVTNKAYPVKQGDIIGISGNSGNTTGPHCHLGLRLRDIKTHYIINRDNGYDGCVDPIPYLRGNKPVYKKCVKQDGKTFGVLIQTPNGDQIIYATDENQWKSWSKPDSYQLSTENPDGSPNFALDGVVQLPW